MLYINYYINGFAEHYMDFDGRARRTEYWSFVLVHALVMALLTVLARLSSILTIAACVYSLAVILPYLAVTIRRLHDTDHSGWWIFIELIPVVGWIWALLLLCKEGMPCPNLYGANPKHRNPPKYI